jgi:hypothetical protein
MGACILPTNHVTATCKAQMGTPNRSPVAWLRLIRETATQVVQTSYIIHAEFKKAFHTVSRRLQEARIISTITAKVTVTPIQISEVMGWTAQGKYVFVSN